ncbi:glycosyltransferase family 4 protein [Pyrobaculum sp.]|uniref:glycosyltransferase family 4 protein n=1 Tax=Pyrobaculum sp. TaxID=2004705 RepID=UPI003171BF0D
MYDVIKYIMRYGSNKYKIYIIDLNYKLKDYIKCAKNSDVVILNSINPLLVKIPYLLAVNQRIIIDIHSPDWLWIYREKTYGIRPGPLTLLKRLMISVFSKMFYCRTLNNFDYEYLSRMCKRAFLIPNPVDTKFFYPKCSKEDKFTILIRYDLSFKGGFDIFLKSLKNVKDIIHNSKVILIGSREVSMELLSTLRRFTKVDVFVKAPREQLPCLYSRSHVTIIPSRFEGFPLIALESLSSGTPIIMSRLPPVSWYLIEIRDGSPGTGMSFNPGDPVDLASRVRAFYDLWLNDKKTYEESTRLARRIAERFDINNVIPQYLKMIEQIINE